MPIDLIERLAVLAAGFPLAVLAAVAILAAAYQTRRLATAHEELYRLAMAGAGRQTPNVGDLALALTSTTPEQLAHAVAQQQDRPNERLGSLLVQGGALTRRELVSLLDAQDAMRSGRRPPLGVTVALADLARERLVSGQLAEVVPKARAADVEPQKPDEHVDSEEKNGGNGPQ